MNSQQAFARHLMSREPSCPDGLSAWNGTDTFLRFAVYRNNVMVSLVEALAETFPVTMELVGKEFFNVMAIAFLVESPPKTKLLAWIGNEFPGYISRFPQADSLPYLADVARLELSRIHAYHAADEAQLNRSELDILVSGRTELTSIRLKLHPSLFLVHSRYAVFSIWAAHHELMDFSSIHPDTAETAMVFRHGLQVETLRLTTAEGHFLQHLLSSHSIEASVEYAMGLDGVLDAPQLIALLIHRQLVTACFWE